MAISDNYSPDKSLGNGVTDTFTGTWKVLNASYFRCALEDVTTGVQTLLTNGSDYTLTFDDTGYSVELTSIPTSANYVLRYRDVETDQTNPYKTSKGFQGETLENSLDKLTAIAQETEDSIGRSPKFKVGSTSVDLLLPEPEDGKVMKWDVSAGQFVNSTSDPDEVVTEAEDARDAAVVAQGLAEDARDAAVVAQGLAEDARDAAAGSATDADNSADLAQDWATKQAATVDGSENSAKAYAQENLGVSGRDEGGSAKDWAQTAENQEVSGGLYSAFHYMKKAQAFASGGLVKVSVNDTTAGYLNGKLVAGDGIALTETNNGGDETLVVSTSTTPDDIVYAYPSVWATIASIIGDIKKHRFAPGKRAIIRVDSGHTIAEQFVFTDGNFQHVVIEQAGRTSLRSATYRWTKIGATNEFYCELAAGGDPSLTEPDILRTSDSLYFGGLPKGSAVGALTVGTWIYGASGAGFNTIIVRMKDDSDPDTAAAGSITFENAVPLDMSGFTVQRANYMWRNGGNLAKAWLVVDNAVGPVLDMRVDGESGTNTGTDKYGAIVANGSLFVGRGCGFEDFAGAGLWAFNSRIFGAYGYYEGTVYGFLSYNSRMEAEKSTFKTTTGSAVLAQFFSILNIDSSVITCTTGRCVYSIGSSISLQSVSATASNSSSDQIISSRGSSISSSNSTCTVSAGNGSCWSANESSTITANGCTGTESGSGYGFKVSEGSFINATSATGSLSQTKNSFSTSGCIFQP